MPLVAFGIVGTAAAAAATAAPAIASRWRGRRYRRRGWLTLGNKGIEHAVLCAGLNEEILAIVAFDRIPRHRGHTDHHAFAACANARKWAAHADDLALRAVPKKNHHWILFFRKN